MLLLTSFIVLYFTATFGIALSQQRDFVRSTCIIEATEIQAETLENTREIFSLNKKSTYLRRSIQGTYAAIALATAAGQVPVVAQLTQLLRMLKQAQKTLDKYQQFLINKAKVNLQTKHYALIAKINSRQHELAKPWQKMISMWGVFRPRSIPQLAIRPDSIGGTAPNYEWVDRAEEKQTLAYSWNMFFYAEKKYQNALSWMNTLSAECSVAPKLKGEKWELQINVGK